MKNGEGRFPYNLAVSLNLCPYVHRFRVDSAINPTELHRLNFSERRLAMFLAFTAVKENTPVI